MLISLVIVNLGANLTFHLRLCMGLLPWVCSLWNFTKFWLLGFLFLLFFFLMNSASFVVPMYLDCILFNIPLSLTFTFRCRWLGVYMDIGLVGHHLFPHHVPNLEWHGRKIAGVVYLLVIGRGESHICSSGGAGRNPRIGWIWREDREYISVLGSGSWCSFLLPIIGLDSAALAVFQLAVMCLYCLIVQLLL